MRKLSCLTLTSLLLLASASSAQAKTYSKSHRAAAQQLFRVMKMGKIFDKVIDKQIDAQVKANPAIARYRNVFRRFMLKYLSWKSLEPDMMRIAMRYFNERELRGLTRFYQTPLGRKAARLMPQLSADGAQLGMRRMRKNMPELQRMIRAARGR